MPTYSKIILTKSNVTLKEPNSADLEYGELAINYKDGKLFFKDDNNVINTLASGGDLTSLINHKNDQTSNPHGVTAADVGLEKVTNKSENDLALSSNDEAALNKLGTSIIGLDTTNWFEVDNPDLGTFTEGRGIITDNGTIKGALQELENEVADGNNNLLAHTSNGANPHGVTAAQLGLVIGTDVQAYSGVLQGTQESFTTSLKDKLDGIEAGAKADQTGAEIKVAYELQANTNAFTDIEKTKLTGIEENAKADQTGAEIKTLYESEIDTNVFTDAEKDKLGAIEAGATADQDLSGLQEKPLEGAFDDGDKTKLDGIAAGAEVNTIESDVTGEPTGSTQVPNIVTMSQADYDAAVVAATIVATTFYIIV